MSGKSASSMRQTHSKKFTKRSKEKRGRKGQGGKEEVGKGGRRGEKMRKGGRER